MDDYFIDLQEFRDSSHVHSMEHIISYQITNWESFNEHKEHTKQNKEILQKHLFLEGEETDRRPNDNIVNVT